MSCTYICDIHRLIKYSRINYTSKFLKIIYLVLMRDY